MPIQVLMPALSPTMTEGTLAKWLKKEGETVESGDVLAEIETDKATMEVEAVEEGTLGRILVKEGTEGVAVNAPIALLLEEGEDESALDEAAEKPAGAPEPKSQDTTSDASSGKSESTEKAPASDGGNVGQAPKPAAKADAGSGQSAKAPAAPASQDGGRVFASPLARRMAEQSGLDLAAVSGSGPQGRIVKRDIEAALEGGAKPAAAAASEGGPAAAPAPAAAPLPEGVAYHDEPHSGMRKVIAQRLSEAKRTIPHFYLSMDCQLDALLALRKDLNDRSPEGEGAYRISVNDFVIRAAALAMRKHPNVNASWTEQAVRIYDSVDISVAVATPGGLITPIVRNADNKGLAAIAGEMKDLAARARDGKLSPEEYQGGGFTISNLGMYGVSEFSAIINPPQSAILAVGAGEQRPVVKDGAVAIATVMTCTLSVDHRSVDGALGAEYLASFKKLIEEPLTMLL